MLNINIKKQQQIKQINEMNKNIKEIKDYRALNIPFPVKTNINSIIPLNLYTCWHSKDLPPYLNHIYEEVKKTNPEFKHYLYDEKMCAEFIKENFHHEVFKAYNNLIPNAYKSDLWRYCVLYINGGIYYDIKFSCKNNFKFIYLTEKEEFISDIEKNNYINGLLVAKPKNEILKKCINKIVFNVKNKFYGTSSLHPTGPKLLGSFFTLDEYYNNPNYFCVKKIGENFNHHCVVFNNRIILLSDNILYRICQSKNQLKPHYGDLWVKKNIYCYS
jgi:mannosyltransferase OCH1-like enzyme